MKKLVIKFDGNDNCIGKQAKVILPYFSDGTFILATIEEEVDKLSSLNGKTEDK